MSKLNCRLVGVRRTRKGAMLAVLRMPGDGGGAEPSPAQRGVLERRGLWVEGMTARQAWWVINMLSYGAELLSQYVPDSGRGRRDTR